MKVKVLMKFRDKYTKNIYSVDEILNITEERFSELIAGPYLFVEKIEECPSPGETGGDNTQSVDPPKDDEQKPSDSEQPKEDGLPLPDSSETKNLNLEKLTKPELVLYAKGLNVELNMNMTKPEMIDRLKSR